MRRTNRLVALGAVLGLGAGVIASTAGVAQASNKCKQINSMQKLLQLSLIHI